MAVPCVCGKRPGENDGFCVCCDRCDAWFHCKCLSLTQKKLKEIDQWFCPTCIRDINISEKIDTKVLELKAYVDDKYANLSNSVDKLSGNINNNNNSTSTDPLKTIHSKDREILTLQQNLEQLRREQEDCLKTINLKDREIASLQENLEQLRKEQEDCLKIINSKDGEIASLQQNLKQLKKREQKNSSEASHSKDGAISTEQQDLEQLRGQSSEAAVELSVVKQPQACKQLKLRKYSLSLSKKSRSQPLPVNDCLDDDDFQTPKKGRKLTGNIEK